MGLLCDDELADAGTSDARAFCHTYGRRENTHEMVPG